MTTNNPDFTVSDMTSHRSYPLIATSIGHFLNDGMVFLVPVIIDLIAAAHGIDPALITASLVAFYVSTAISANLFGRTIDRRHLQSWGMIVGILILSSGLLLFSLALGNVFVSFFVVISSIVSGFGASFYHPTGTAILQSYYKGSRLGRYLGINGSAGSLGRALYPSLLVLVSILLLSNTSSAFFFGVVGIILAIVIYMFMREYVSRERNARNTLSARSQSSSNGVSNTSTLKTTIPLGIILLTIMSLVRNLAFFSIVSWIPEYFTFVRGLGTSLGLSTMMTLMFSGGILGQLLIGILVERYDKRMILVVTTVFSVLFMFLYLMTTGPISILTLVLFGFFNFSGFPIFMSMISDYVPRGSTTLSNGLVWNLGGTAGQAIGPLVIGVYITGRYSHLPVAFETMLVLGLLSVLIAFALPKPAKESKAPLFA
ncbi:MAG: MFS transporter [Candidatus Thermoplasmatota archaeon]|jgi:MFS family permease|nr:MFS transporter [Candidatus Thermoplasmatota archaeon]